MVMSESPSTPTPTPPKFDGTNLVLLLAFLAVVAGLLVCAFRDSPRLRYLFDSSMGIEDVWRSGDNVVENGYAYDQATVPLPPGSQLVVRQSQESARGWGRLSWPITVRVRDDGQPDVVRVLIEKKHNYYGHPAQSMYLRDFRAGVVAFKRQVGQSLVIDVDSGFWTSEGGSTISVIFVIPPGTQVRLEPIDSPWFAGRHEDGHPVSEAVSLAAGWEIIPQQPLPRRQFR